MRNVSALFSFFPFGSSTTGSEAGGGGCHAAAIAPENELFPQHAPTVHVRTDKVYGGSLEHAVPDLAGHPALTCFCFFALF